MEHDLEAGNVEAERRSEEGSQTSLPHRGQTPTRSDAEAKASDDGPGLFPGGHQDGGPEHQPAVQPDEQASGDPVQSIRVPEMLSQKKLWTRSDSRQEQAPPGKSAFNRPEAQKNTVYRPPGRGQPTGSGQPGAQPSEPPEGLPTPEPTDAQSGGATNRERPLERLVAVPAMSNSKIRELDDPRKQERVPGKSAFSQQGSRTGTLRGGSPRGLPGGTTVRQVLDDEIGQMQQQLANMQEVREALAREAGVGAEQRPTPERATARMGNTQIATMDEKRKEEAPPPKTTQAGPQSELSTQNVQNQMPYIDDCEFCTNFAEQKALHHQHKARHKDLLSPDSDDEDDETGRRKHSAANKGFVGAFREAFRAARGKDEDDDEEQKTGVNRNKDKYDIDGRKHTWSRKKLEREQPWTPKKHFYPQGVSKDPPKPTYLDRHGRTELQVFQALVGVYFLDNAGAPLPTEQKQQQPASVMSDIFWQSRAAAYRHRNRGLYDRCISEDMKMRVMYSFSHYVISFLYILQIFVAATLTGLSAYTDLASGSTAVTVLGAINTVLAGVLAWLTGKGMPIRYRRARDQFREVVREIEASERMFAVIDYMDWPEGKRPTPIGERDRLEKLYEQARQDQEANYPDTHEGPDKNAHAAEARTLKQKAEKHKNEKRAAASKLEALLVQKRELEAKVADGLSSGSEEVEEKLASVAKRGKELEEREAKLLTFHQMLMQVKEDDERRIDAFKRAVWGVCEDEGLDPEKIGERLSERLRTAEGG